MLSSDLRRHLEALRDGGQSVDGVLEILRDFPYQDIGFAKIDHHRPLRKGFPEVVLGKGKTPEQISEIVAALSGRGNPVLVTKTGTEAFDAVRQQSPTAQFNQLAGTIVVPTDIPAKTAPRLLQGVTVVTAGTADLAVAEEAAITAELMGSQVSRINDVGVAGLHRLLDVVPDLREARVLVVVAGMDAALASVVGGLVPAPVFAVPTSQGYGSSFEGMAALLSMLNSCSPGVAVVNIDNGFGAGYMAAQINQMGRSAED